VCHDLLADPKLYVFLLHIDEEQAAQTREALQPRSHGAARVVGIG